MFLLFIAALLLALPLHAEASKLNARARTAVQRLETGIPAQQLMAEGASVNAEGDIDAFIVGDATRDQLEALGVVIRSEVLTENGFVRTAFIPPSAMDAVAGLAGVNSIEGSAPIELENDMSVPTTNANNLRGAGPTFTGLNGAGVLVGDVDTGVDYNHGDFLDAGGNSRFVSIWDQTVAGVFPAGFAYGSEWTNAQLTANAATEVDADGHGSHVMGTLGGDGSQGLIPFQYAGMAPAADLCMVKTNFQTTGVFDGVSYIMGRATALGKNCAVNLSLGSHFGPHDGTSAFESGLSALCGPGRIIVKSAGNERSTTNLRHAEVLAAGAGTNCTMTVSGSANGRILAIDGYFEASENINVQITTPGGTIIGPITVGNLNAAYPGTLTPNGRVYLENGVSLTATGDKEVYIEINATGTTSNGTWTFRFIPVALGAANGEVDLWRFFNSTGFTGNFALGQDNTSELVSEPGNAVQLITTAAWVSRQNWVACNGVLTTFTGTPLPGPLASFSSMGPTRDGRPKPDIAAPGMAILSTRSFDVATACPAAPTPTALADGGNHTANAGTSMAAPHTTGASALIMQKYGAVTPAFIKTFLAARAIVDGFTGAVPNNDWGAGKLNLGDMLDPTVTVLAPNGGETLYIGAGSVLTWNATDNVGVTNVDLYLSRNGVGGPWVPIALSVPNTGSYAWTVTGPVTTQALLRVVATDGAANVGQDDSDNLWTIQDLATGTLLSTFEAASIERGIELRWGFGSSTSFSNVTVQRSGDASGPWQTIPVELRSEGNLTVAVDRNVESGQTYFYRLTARASDGTMMTFGPLSGTAGQSVTAFALSRVWPNPTPGSVRIDYAVPKASDVSVKILDVQGREVATLASGPHRPGTHQAIWTGRVAERAAAPGLYFVQMKSNEFQQTRRVVVSH